MDSNITVDDSDETEEERTQFCYDIIKDIYDFTFKNIDNLDEKASKFIVFAGIIISFYSVFGKLVLEKIDKNEMFYVNKYYLLLSILAICIIFLFVSIYFAVEAYKLRDWNAAPNAANFHEKYVITGESKKKISDNLMTAFVHTIKQNQPWIESKANLIKKSSKSFNVGLFICVIFIFLSLMV